MEKIFEHFTISVLKLNKLVQRIKQREMREYGLKAIHVMCCYYLKEHPEGLTASELVKLTLEDKAAISRALKLLGEKGYVSGETSRHGSAVKLTPKGEELAEYIGERSLKAVEAGSAALSDGERELFYKALGSIADNLSSYLDEICSEDNGG